TVVPHIPGNTVFDSTDSIAAAFGTTTAAMPQFWVLGSTSAGQGSRPFLGFSSEDLDLALDWSDTITYALVGLAGPGEFTVWNGNRTAILGSPVMSSADGIDPSLDFLTVDTGSHEHF